MTNIPPNRRFKKSNSFPLRNKVTFKPGSREAHNYLRDVVVVGMRKVLCFGCAFSKLYDKNNKEYRIHNRYATLEGVKAIVEEIRKINES